MNGTRAEAYKRQREAERALSVDGVMWFEAKIPHWLHRCYAHTSGVVSLKRVERCACGAIRYEGSLWLDRNSRRKSARG